LHALSVKVYLSSLFILLKGRQGYLVKIPSPLPCIYPDFPIMPPYNRNLQTHAQLMGKNGFYVRKKGALTLAVSSP
jgi:hypothetical protein